MTDDTAAKARGLTILLLIVGIVACGASETEVPDEASASHPMAVAGPEVDAGAGENAGMCLYPADAVRADIQRELADRQLTNVSVDAPQPTVERMTCASEVAFDEALGAALDSLLTDDSDEDSPLARTIRYRADGWMPAGCSKEDATEVLRCVISSQGAAMALYSDAAVEAEVGSATRPEFGEDPAVYWIFSFVFAGDLGSHISWAIVLRARGSDGSIEVYNNAWG
jgi:hypothetical protein